LLTPPQKIIPAEGKLQLSFTLPIHGISLLCISAGA